MASFVEKTYSDGSRVERVEDASQYGELTYYMAYKKIGGRSADAYSKEFATKEGAEKWLD